MDIGHPCHQAAFDLLQEMRLRQLATQHATSSLMRAAAKAFLGIFGKTWNPFHGAPLFRGH